MTSTKLLDTISSLEELARSAPQELHDQDGLRKRLLDAVQKLVPEIETPAEMSQRLLYLPCEIMGAKIGVDLDIFNVLSASDRPLSTEELAQNCGAESALLLRLLKYMSSVRLIKESDTGLWVPSNMTRNLASRHSAAGVNHVHDSVMPAYHALPSWLNRRGYKTPTAKTDTPFAQGHGASPDQSFFSWLQVHPYNATEFNIFMGVHRTGMKTWLDQGKIHGSLCKAHEAGGDENGAMFVDVGGGIGQQCKALRARYPELKGRIILQDLPQVIQKADVGDDIEAMSMDFFEGQPIKSATVYYLRSILRDWPDAQCRTILGHIRDAMAAHSLIFIDELVLPDRGAHKVETQLDMTMLSMLNGEARTESHWRRLLEESGLKVQDIVSYQNAGSEAVIVAKGK
ncbi:S-adenosyl-L-methionine-dependent methyltransferase [Zopfia rhizophila CBS 207.26]|uniref:S-adenosyl-L-methionine-dependent methyltransferase n=1 Tax=Zopfia rhizophila CBS 207.26 TaxID=1314779 RepID=A0A6A6ER90_9PEZI|nr:S-adenosyl-L-methionine-dependent methyltransferase [Zopfia rhizophila CBS 207.26]